MPKGRGIRRQRNKAARLPAAYRRQVLSLLLDAVPYEAIRTALREAGCPAELLPSRKALAAYRDSGEFREAHQKWAELSQRAAERHLLASAVQEGGVQALADVATFEILDEVVTLAKSASSSDESPEQRISRLALSLNALQDALTNRDKVKLAREKLALAQNDAPQQGGRVVFAPLPIPATLTGEAAK